MNRREEGTRLLFIVPRALSVALALLFAAGPALAAKVYVDYDAEYEFAGKTTFAWSEEGTLARSELNQKRIDDAIRDALAEKGVTEVEEGGVPDLLVITDVSTSSRTESKANVGIGFGKSFGWGGVSVGGSRGVGSKTIDVGTLLIQIIDATGDNLVWEARMSDSLSAKPEKIEKQIRRAVSKAFKKYPPKQKR